MGHQRVARIYRALPEYAELQNKPWPVLSPRQLPLKKGMHSTMVPIIHQRLVWLGDAHSAPASDKTLYGPALAGAVRQFQWRHGLKADGAIGEKTLAALNVSPAQRLRQLQLNMQRLSQFPKDEGSHYILVNAANFKLNIIKEGDSVLDMRVVVGKPSRATPELYSKVRTMVFNPKWNIPKKIAQEDIIPKMLKNPDYLAEQNIKIYNSWAKNALEVDPNHVDWQKAEIEGFPYRMTQASGDNNALGLVKFIFTNEHDVYMHDTPQKGLFESVQRAYSSGCIRLEEPFQLVEYFLENNPAMDQEKVDEVLSSGELKYIRIKHPVPIYIAYITAWVDQQGLIHFREDIYRRDS